MMSRMEIEPDSVGEETTPVPNSMDELDTKRFFSPALWRQRRTLASATLKLHTSHKVCDIGCGEGALLQILLNDTQFTYLAGVDIDMAVLTQCHFACQPTELDFNYLRELPVDLDLFQGSLDQPDERLIGFDAMTCLEVIEHLDPPVLAAFPAIVLGIYRPALLIVSTPNAEFNIHFPGLYYNTPHSKFRHNDHRFEWTRHEFQEWATQISAQYGYNVRFTGVGVFPSTTVGSVADVGFCSQFAIFCRRDGVSTTLLPEHRLAMGVSEPAIRFIYVSRTSFPYFEEVGFTDANIIQEIQDRVQYIVTPPRDAPSLVIPVGAVVEVSDLWNVLRIRQVCKTRARLIDALLSSDSNKIFKLSADGREITVLYAIPALEYAPWISPSPTASPVSNEETDSSSDEDGTKRVRDFKRTVVESEDTRNAAEAWGKEYEDVSYDAGEW